MSSAHAAGARVKLYYTVRELSTSAPELWAFRAMRGEVVIKSPVAGGNAWLREHLRGGYDAAWHEVRPHIGGGGRGGGEGGKGGEENSHA